MPTSRRLAVVLMTISAVVLGVASPSSAVGAKPSVTTTSCEIASPETISGTMFVNNQTVNGTWTYSTGVACPMMLGDILLYEELDFNGTKVNSNEKNFTGVPRYLDAITSSYHCVTCNGTWLFKWGQILKAPSGFTFTGAFTGCVIIQSGQYELCVQTKTVTI